MPTDIITLTTANENRFNYVGEVNDNQGNEYDDAIHLSYVCSVKTDYQYSMLTGVFFQSGKYSSSPVYHTLKIYGAQYASLQDDLLWEGKVKGDTTPCDFCIDISQYYWIRFNLDITDPDENTYLSDVYIWE